MAHTEVMNIHTILTNFCLMDDDFMTKCLDGDRDAARLILTILLKRTDFHVLEIRTQEWLENLAHRSLRLDIKILDDEQNIYNIEIQRDSRGAGCKRARYHASALDMKQLEKGDDFADLKDTFVIFISEHDVLGAGEPIYHIERMIQETNTKFGDGTHILYVNGSYRGEDEIGRLMYDFHCKNPDEMYYQPLADRTRYFKEMKEGKQNMSRLMEEFEQQAIQRGMELGKQIADQQVRTEGREEGRKEGLVEAARKLMAARMVIPEQIMQVLGLSEEDLLEFSNSHA